MRRIMLSSIFVLFIFSGLLDGLYWRTRGIPPVQAQPRTDPMVIWSIGITDNAGDESSSRPMRSGRTGRPPTG
jgi:hypothetical protein